MSALHHLSMECAGKPGQLERQRFSSGRLGIQFLQADHHASQSGVDAALCRRTPYAGVLVAWLFILGISLACVSSLRAASVDEAFDAANKLYEQGRFAEAAEAYQKLANADSGARSATVLFNLGNAHYKAGQLGRALAAYLQAERLSPRDPSVAFNLQFVRKKVSGTEDMGLPLWDRALQALTLNEWTLLTSTGLWILFLLLALGELRETSRSALRRYALMAAIATALLGVTTAAAHHRSKARDAVIVASDAIVRSGPLDEARVLFQLRDGTEVRIEDEKNVGAGSGNTGQIWYQLRDRLGRTGWIKQDQLVRIL